MVKHGSKTKKVNPIDVLNFIFKEERRSSLLLIAAAISALVLANGVWAADYTTFFGNHLKIGFVDIDRRHWINDGLMALFFLVVGLEIKREFIDGELKTWRKASFPIIAAIGGMVVPALIFSSINPYIPQSSGWAIPMATDIAIALGVVGLLGKRIHKSLRVFLLTLAIVDDIGSILVISLFYNHPTNTFALVFATVVVLALALVRTWRFWPLVFLVLGMLLGYCLLAAGVSATLAGVVIALLMPLNTRRRNAIKLQTSETIERFLIPLTAFVIVPLFVFANAGITLADVSLKSGGGLSVFIGVLLGLLIGKPLGILFAAWIGDTLRISQKPRDISWNQLLAIGFIAGIGFTISILIADLAYTDSPVLQSAAVLGVFSASIISGAVGLVLLTVHTKRSPKHSTKNVTNSKS